MQIIFKPPVASVQFILRPWLYCLLLLQLGGGGGVVGPWFEILYLK